MLSKPNVEEFIEDLSKHIDYLQRELLKFKLVALKSDRYSKSKRIMLYISLILNVVLSILVVLTST